MRAFTTPDLFIADGFRNVQKLYGQTSKKTEFWARKKIRKYNSTFGFPSEPNLLADKKDVRNLKNKKG